tara:strand:+ start:547 stop:954 length:408 start_codon:yes stop_codon:yes gene_type:complete
MNKNKEIRSAGLKVTQARRAILGILENEETVHVSADDIHRKLNKSGDEVGIATIYRFLNQFVSAGICIRHNFETGQSLYELTPDHHHDHMVCLTTGKVVEFEDEMIEKRQEKVAAQKGYRIVDHTLVLYVEPLEK